MHCPSGLYLTWSVWTIRPRDLACHVALWFEQMSLLKWPETSLRDSPTITIVNFFVATSVDNTYTHCTTIVIVVVQYVLSTSSNKKLTIGQFFIYDRMTVEGRAMYFVKWPLSQTSGGEKNEIQMHNKLCNTHATSKDLSNPMPVIHGTTTLVN